MMLVHQGLPQWQFRFTTMGLTPFAEVKGKKEQVMANGTIPFFNQI